MSDLVLYEGENLNLEVFFQDETVWLTQKQIAEVFEVDRTVVTKHVKNIFSTNEVTEKSNVQKMHIPFSDKPVSFYNLDIVLAVGYRVNTKKGIQFRQWATKILREKILESWKQQEHKKEIQLAELEKILHLVSSSSVVDLNSSKSTKKTDQRSIKKIADFPLKVLHLQRDRIAEIKKYWHMHQAFFSINIDTINLLENSGIGFLELRQSLIITICVLYRSLFQNRDLGGGGGWKHLEPSAAFSENFWKLWKRFHDEIVLFVDGSFAHQDTTKTVKISVRGKEENILMRWVYENVDGRPVWNMYPNLAPYPFNEAFEDMFNILCKAEKS